MPANNEIVRVSAGSTADIPQDLAQKHGIIINPGLIIFGNEEYSDTPEFALENFYEKMEKSKEFPRTAAPGPNVFENNWATYQGPILPITAGDKLSSFYNAATLARTTLRERTDETKRENIYEPWNSMSVSLGEGFPAIIAAEMLEQGISIGEVIRRLDATRERMHVFAVAGSTEFYIKSGHISGAKGYLSQVLRIKPCVTTWNNEIVPFKNYRTYKEATTDLAERAAQRGPIERMAVVHTGNEEIAQQMVKAVEDINLFDPKKILIGPTTKVIAAHNGRDSFGLIYLGAPHS